MSVHRADDDNEYADRIDGHVESGPDPFRGAKSQWATSDDVSFYTVGRVRERLVPGAYLIGDDRGKPFFTKFDIQTDNILQFDDNVSGQVAEEVAQFWDRAKVFREHNISHRRGIMMTGPAGSGKSCAIKLVCADVIRRGGVVLPFACGVDTMLAGMREFRELQPDTPIVCLMEDIESLLQNMPVSSVLNMLDGVHSELQHIVYLATTNYPERLEERITKRPQRFDKIIEVSMPSLKTRIKYLTHIAEKSPVNVFDPARAAGDTTGMSFAFMKELFIRVVVFGADYAEALRSLRERMTKPLRSSHRMERNGAPAGFAQQNDTYEDSGFGD